MTTAHPARNIIVLARADAPKTGPYEGLKIWGEVGIICPLIEIGLPHLSKYGRIIAPLPPGSDGPLRVLGR